MGSPPPRLQTGTVLVRGPRPFLRVTVQVRGPCPHPSVSRSEYVAWLCPLLPTAVSNTASPPCGNGPVTLLQNLDL